MLRGAAKFFRQNLQKRRLQTGRMPESERRPIRTSRTSLCQRHRPGLSLGSNPRGPTKTHAVQGNLNPRPLQRLRWPCRGSRQWLPQRRRRRPRDAARRLRRRREKLSVWQARPLRRRKKRQRVPEHLRLRLRRPMRRSRVRRQPLRTHSETKSPRRFRVCRHPWPHQLQPSPGRPLWHLARRGHPHGLRRATRGPHAPKWGPIARARPPALRKRMPTPIPHLHPAQHLLRRMRSEQSSACPPTLCARLPAPWFPRRTHPVNRPPPLRNPGRPNRPASPVLRMQWRTVCGQVRAAQGSRYRTVSQPRFLPHSRAWTPLRRRR
jgi:hypothetical protein